MKTDWNLVRELMNSVIDASEAVEGLTAIEADRHLPTGVDQVSVYDVLQSAWIYPENVQYRLVIARHKLGMEKPYTSETARALINVAKVCAELVGAGEAEPIRETVQKLAAWYPEQMVPQVEAAVREREKKS